MFNKHLFNAAGSASGLNATAEPASQHVQLPTNATLKEPDRRAVDFVLGGESSASEEISALAFQSSFMERVNGVRRLMGLLDNLSVQDPPAHLLEATLRRLPPVQTAAPAVTQVQHPAHVVK